MLLETACTSGEPSSSRSPLPSITNAFFRESLRCSSEYRFHAHAADKTIGRAQISDSPDMTASGIKPAVPSSTKKAVNVQGQVVDSDEDFWRANGLRGGFYESKPGGARWATSESRGLHWVQAFVIRKRDRVCLDRSERFFVIVA
jgi:hypothetical protein